MYRGYCKAISQQSWYVFLYEVPIVASICGVNVTVHFEVEESKLFQVCDAIWELGDKPQKISVDIVLRDDNCMRAMCQKSDLFDALGLTHNQVFHVLTLHSRDDRLVIWFLKL